MDIKNVKDKKHPLYVDVSGTKRYYPDVFRNDDEKERASKIARQLEGMTIREAQDFLSRISETLIDAHTL